MGLHVYQDRLKDGSTALRFGWKCDVCGKEIKNPRNGAIDFTCFDPPKDDYFDYIVFHTEGCTPVKNHRYWRQLNYVGKHLSAATRPLD